MNYWKNCLPTKKMILSETNNNVKKLLYSLYLENKFILKNFSFFSIFRIFSFFLNTQQFLKLARNVIIKTTKCVFIEKSSKTNKDVFGDSIQMTHVPKKK